MKEMAFYSKIRNLFVDIQHKKKDQDSSLDDKYLWHIKGKRYDFRSFVSKHPAGPKLILLGQGRDCTELFESYHALTDRPQSMLSNFEVRHREAPKTESSFYWKETPLYDAMKKRVRLFFEAKGRSHKASNGMLCRILVGIIALAATTYCWLLGCWWTLIGLPLVYWTTCSLLLHSGHHIHTNVDGKDPDLMHFQHLEPDKAPGYRLTKLQPWVPKYKNYKFAIFFQANFTTLGPALLCEPLYYSTDAYLGVVPFMYISPLDRAKHWVGRGLVFGWMFVLPFALHGPVKGLFFSFVPYLLLGCIYFAFSQVSHLNAGCFERASPAGGSSGGKPEWAAHQVLTACDYSTASWLWGFLSIGLNNQVVHHLFPAVDPCHYPDLAPIVAATCKEFGVRYTCFRNWWEVWAQFIDWVECLNAVEPKAVPGAEGCGGIGGTE